MISSDKEQKSLSNTNKTDTKNSTNNLNNSEFDSFSDAKAISDLEKLLLEEENLNLKSIVLKSNKKVEEYNKKIEQKKLEYNQKIEQQKIDYNNRINKLNNVVEEQKITIVNQEKKISSKEDEVNQLNQVNNTLDKKLLDLEKEIQQFNKIIGDNKLNQEDLSLIVKYKEENTILINEINILKSELQFSDTLVENLNNEKKELFETINSVNESNEKLNSEVVILNSQIQEYEDTLSVVGTNDFLQKAKNLLGIGVDQEIIIDQLKKNNASLIATNKDINTKSNELSILNSQLQEKNSSLKKEINKIDNQNKFNNFENLKLKNQLVKIQSQYQVAQKTIKSQNLELEGLRSQIIELNATKNDSNFLETNTNLDYVITNKRVNLRDLPQIPSTVKYIINPGQKLELIEEKGDWVEVNTSSKVKGFIFKKFISFNPNQEIQKKNIDSSSDLNSQSKKNNKTDLNSNLSGTDSELLLTVKLYLNLNRGDKLSVNTDVNMRNSASKTSDIVDVITKGEVVLFDSVIRGWIKVISLSQDVGYIDSRYLHIVN